jgi:UDP-glucose 4-epimerase
MKWTNKRVLITGGAGFIGSSLAKRLLKENAHVVVLDNFSVGRKENIPSGCEIVIGDISDEKILNKVKDIDYVFHFGAPSSSVLFNENPNVREFSRLLAVAPTNACVRATVSGFVNVLEWAKRMDVKKVIYPSSGTVYGNTSLPQREDMLPRPVSLYAISKLFCEHIAEIYDVPSVGLRIFTGYGSGEKHKGKFASVITLFLNSLLRNERPVVFGDGSQKRDFVYIDDIVEATLRSAEDQVRGIINVGSGRSYSFNEVLDMLNSMLGKKIEPIYVNKFANYRERTLADITKMKAILGIEPISLEEGLKRYLEVIER